MSDAGRPLRKIDKHRFESCDTRLQNSKGFVRRQAYNAVYLEREAAQLYSAEQKEQQRETVSVEMVSADTKTA